MVYSIASVVLIVYMIGMLLIAWYGYYSGKRAAAKRADDQPLSGEDVRKKIVDLGLSNAITDGDTIADDLKQIHGIGPKIEGVLHAIGIYKFSQIAAWSDADVEKVDAHLIFHGRIVRDDWIGQAKKLAEK